MWSIWVAWGVLVNFPGVGFAALLALGLGVLFGSLVMLWMIWR